MTSATASGHLRILHAATLLSPDGAFGGPIRVSLNQAQALRSRGHAVTLAAAERGFAAAPTSTEGTPLVLRRARRLVPRTGFAGICAPDLVTWLIRTRVQFDVAHIHLARDLVLLPLAVTMAKLKIPFVIQPHGMILPGTHPLAPLLDHAVVGKLLRRAHEVFYLTTDERDALDEISAGKACLTLLPNGVPLYEAASHARAIPEVLYLARLHPRKRPVDFVEAAIELNARGVTADYTLVGPDEGEGSRVRQAAAPADNINWEGPVAGGDGPARMRRATMYVLPSVGPEPYPMAVLEAMSVGLPVVVTEQCGLAPTVRKYNCGIVIAPGAHNVARAVHDLLAAPDAARSMGHRGRAAVIHDLGLSNVGQRLEASYVAAACNTRQLV
ncbi:glycosyltransferase [Mycobacterium sp. 21AC1]|uniref:glycosyltransferase n=1 Tax=[Mycobacterium] appelbergii TaxID=2939269 RepID=UPI0029393A5A|nr:glycosyltransferase [Mycobacterium sp. 21AC1]MDV3128674.1 glycosyltransferase [Mycobacterium sp. 21AC1]